MTTPTSQNQDTYEKFWNHLLKYPFEFTDKFGNKSNDLRGALFIYCDDSEEVEEVFRLFYDKYPELFDEINDESKIKYISEAFYDYKFEEENFHNINDYLLEGLMKIYIESQIQYVIK